MTVKGHVRDGVIVLDDPIELPDGAEVCVELPPSSRPLTWAERFKDVIGTVDDLPTDMAKNHDHYLHGAHKK